MKLFCLATIVSLTVLVGTAVNTLAWSAADRPQFNRRGFLSKTVAAGAAIVTPFVAGNTIKQASAAPQIFNTPNGVKYAITKESTSKVVPQDKDIVAIEYTGYLTDGSIFDATHAQGKKNALMFEVGGNAVIPGLNEIVKNMSVGQKVQAIIPPGLAFGEKGVCLENGECLVKPNSTLVYDVYLKTSAIPPP